MSGFLSQTCEDENKCSRIGKPHLSFTPGVDDKGEIIDFKTEPEAEYPPEMAGAIAASICRELQKLEPASCKSPASSLTSRRCSRAPGPQ